MTTSTAFINYINTGTGVNSGDGDSLRTAFNKINLNFKNILNSFVAAGVASFNSQTGIITFTGTDIINQLGYIPYPTSNPLGFITNDTANLQNYATITYVNDNFVSELDLSAYNFASVNYVDAKLTEYPSLVYLNNQGYLVPATLPNFLTAYSTQTDLANLTTSLQSFTTSSIFEAVNNSSIIPSVADTYDLGEESYRWGTLYLSNAAYIKGIGITIDPITSRLIVDGNSVTGAFRFNPSAIYNEAGVGFSISSTEPDPLAAQQKVRIYVPTDTDGDTIPLDVTNTGTSGLVLQGHTKSISINENGISFTGSLSSPLILNETSGQFLKIGKKADVYITSTGTFTTYTNTAEISAYNTSSNSTLVLSGSRVVLNASTASAHNQNVQTAYVSLDETGLYIGRTRTNGYGSISDPNVFEGLRIPLGKGAPGDILAITTATNNINTVAYITPQISPFAGTFTITNTTSAFSTNSGALRVAGGVGVGGDLYAGNIYSNGVQLTLGGLAGGSLTSVGSHIIPSADLTYDLGSTSSQWRSLYVGTSTIYLGGTALSVSGGNLTVDGSPVAGGGGATSTLVAGTATLSINTLSETVLPSGLKFEPIENYGFGFGGTIAMQTYGEQLQVIATGTGAFGLFGYSEVIGGPGGVAYLVGNQDGTNEVKIVAGSYNATVNTWKFGDDGNLIVPNAILGSGDQALVIQNTASGVAYLELPVDPSAYSVILANQAASSATVTIRVGAFGGGSEKDWTFNEFGSLAVPPGGIYNNDTSNVGQLLLAGDVGEADSYLALPSNVGSTSMNVRLGNISGNIQLIAGNNKNWYFNTSGDLELPGGSVLATSGYDVALVAGNDSSSTFGSVTISTQYPPDLTDRNWEFNSLGELYLPLGGAIQETQVTNELWGTTTTSLTLVPGGAANGTQRLEIYSTGGGEGNHIHITSGDQSQTDLFLGNDTQFFAVGAMGQIEVRARPGLDSPSPGTGAESGSPVWIYAGDAGDNGGNVADGASGGDVLLQAGISSAGTGGEIILISANGPAGFGSVKLSTDGGSSHLEFDKDGKLTLPSGGTLGPEGMGASGLSNGTSGNPVYIVNKKTNGDYLANIILTAGDGISGEISFQIWNTETSSVKTLSINTASNLVFNDGTIYAGSSAYVPYATSSSFKITTEMDFAGPPYTPFTFEVQGSKIILPNGNGYIQSGTGGGLWALDSANQSFDFPNSSRINYGDGGYLSTGTLQVDVRDGGTFEIKLNDTNKTWAFDNTGVLEVPGSIIPSTDVAYDLGSPTKRFRDIYVSTSTIYLGTSTISISNDGQMLVNGATADAKFEYFGGEGSGPRDAAYIAWNTSTITFNIPQPELLRAFYDLKPGSQIRGANTLTAFDRILTITGTPREYIRAGGYNMAEITVAETTGTNEYIHHLFLPVKDKSAVLANGTWTVAVNTTGTIVFPNGTIQTGAAISIAELKVLVAASTDFADFKSRIAAL